MDQHVNNPEIVIYATETYRYKMLKDSKLLYNCVCSLILILKCILTMF